MDREVILKGLTPAIVTGLIAAIANVLKLFNVVDITQAQIDALNALAVALMLILGTIGAAYARDRVTPTSSPALPEGKAVTLPDGTPGAVVKV